MIDSELLPKVKRYHWSHTGGYIMFVNPKICYIITSSPRSGSHLFSTLLAGTGLAGDPQEHFNPWHMGDATNFFPDDLLYGREYVQGLIQTTTTSNGVFGTKAQFIQITNFVGLDRLESLFPTPLKYIYIQRLDVDRQAVSLARAEQTDSFNSDRVPTKEPVYNFYQIQQCAREIRIQAKGWETYFQTRGISPYRVVYEELVKDRVRFVRGALEYLGIPIPSDFQVPETHLKKQADLISDQWVAKFQQGEIH